MLNGKRILITGGTGFWACKFVAAVLARFPRIGEMVIFSRSREKQREMAACFPGAPLVFRSGDMADAGAVEAACRQVDVIVHTAALRIVPEAEASPREAIHTNVIGAENLIRAAVKQGVGRLLALSTDMASRPDNVYGATKMLADRLFVAAAKEYPQLRTVIVRYGNILGSAGTVIPFFMRKAREEGVLPVTDPGMTRFMATGEECVEIALRALANVRGGEIIAPKLKSYDILTLARAVDERAEIRVVGLRPGERLFQEMVTAAESSWAIENREAYILVPPYGDKAAFCAHYNACPVTPGFCYTSENNPERAGVEEMRKIIRAVYPSPAFPG